MNIEENKKIVEEFLTNHEGFAFMAHEISDLTGLMPQETIYTLNLLEKEKKVEKWLKEGLITYWFIAQ